MPKFMRMTLRMPTGLFDWLKSQADKEGRSMTAHIVELLKEARQKAA